jgi:hypothetical protein
MMNPSIRLVLASALLPLALAAGPAHAYILGDSDFRTVNALTLDGSTKLANVDSGWYRNDFFHDPRNTNYAAGPCAHCALPPGNNHNNFFVFDISALSAPVSTLKFTVFTFSSLETLFYSLHDYKGSVTALRDGTGGAAAYEDLATGAPYGGAVVGPAINYTFLSLPLSAAAVADFNEAIRTHQSYFVIGGTALPVPEASAPVMALSGLAVLGWLLGFKAPRGTTGSTTLDG